MSVEATVELHKHVFWAGDSLQAFINLSAPSTLAKNTQNPTNAPPSETAPDTSDSAGLRTVPVMWVAAQIAGHYRVQRHFVSVKSLPPSNRRASLKVSHVQKGKTALPNLYEELGDDSRCIFLSPPIIVDADFSVSQGQAPVRYQIEGRIPPFIPPSYRSSYIRIVYQLIVGVQLSTQKIELYSTNFRVLPGVSPCIPFPRELKDYDYRLSSDKVPWSKPIDDLISFQMSKESQRAKATEDEIKKMIRRNRTSSIYSIGHSQSTLAKCTLAKEHYRLGESVTGTIDFTNSTTSCFQTTIELISEENMNPEMVLPGRPKQTRTAVFSKSEIVAHTRQTFFSFIIPASSYPSFSSDMVSLRWLLRVVFYISSDPSSTAQFKARPDIILHHLPDTKIEAVEWELPINVYGCRDAAEGFSFMLRHRDIANEAVEEWPSSPQIPRAV